MQELLSKPSRSGRSIRRRKKTFARRVELEEVLNEVRQEMHEAIKAKDYSLCLGEGGLMEEYRSLESMKANLPTSKEVSQSVIGWSRTQCAPALFVRPPGQYRHYLVVMDSKTN